MAGCVLKDALGCSSHPLAPAFTTPPPSPSPGAFLGCGSRSTLSHNSSHPPGPNAIKYLLFLRGRPGQFRFPSSSSPSPRSAFFLRHGVGGFATVSRSCVCYGDSASERTEELFYLQEETSLRSFLEEMTTNVAQIPQMLLRASGYLLVVLMRGAIARELAYWVLWFSGFALYAEEAVNEFGGLMRFGKGRSMSQVSVHPMPDRRRNGFPSLLRSRATADAEKSPAAPVPVGGVENLVIIGSGPAGYTAAIYAARANLKPVVFEGYQAGGVAGGQLMTTTEVENFPGFPEGVSGPDLMDRMRKQAERWGAELNTEDVESIDVLNRPFTVRSSDREVKCHSIIIATGATAKRLGLPREHEFWSRGISACAICDGASPIFKGQELAVVGGGDTATEETLYLTKYARHVHLLVRREKLRASKAMQDRVFNNPNVSVYFNTETVDIVSNEKGQMSGLKVRNVTSGEERQLEVRGLFYGIGHRPNSQLLEGQVELDDAGYVIVKDGSTDTSVEGVYAAGDLQDHEWRQAITAAGSGCMAALSVERYLVSNDLLVEFHQQTKEEVKKELTTQDVDMGFDVTLTKHKGQYALRKLYHESPRLIGVLYTSPTCGPCRSLKPILNKLLKRHSANDYNYGGVGGSGYCYLKVIDEYADEVHFVEIDIEEDPEIAEAGGVMGTPCVQFFKNKERIKDMAGVKMKREYREFIVANK